MRATLTTWAVLLALAVPLTADDKDGALTPERRQELEKQALELSKEGEAQYRRGEYAAAKDSFRQPREGEYGKAEPFFKEALAMYRALFPREKYPQGHPDLANGLNNLALLHRAAGEYGKALPLYRDALEMQRALFSREKYPRGHPHL